MVEDTEVRQHILFGGLNRPLPNKATHTVWACIASAVTEVQEKDTDVAIIIKKWPLFNYLLKIQSEKIKRCMCDFMSVWWFFFVVKRESPLFSVLILSLPFLNIWIAPLFIYIIFAKNITFQESLILVVLYNKHKHIICQWTGQGEMTFHPCLMPRVDETVDVFKREKDPLSLHMHGAQIFVVHYSHWQFIIRRTNSSS